MISEKLNSIHKNKEAIPNQIYKDIDNQVYKGTKFGRLNLVPNYEDINSLINKNIKLENKLDVTDFNFDRLNKKLTYSQFELDGQDNLMPKINYMESEYFFLHRGGGVIL